MRADRWVGALGEYGGVLDDLPEELDRSAGRRFALSRPQSPEGALAAFVASQIWGYGTNGYGPFRLGEALAHPGLAGILHELRGVLEAGDPVAAFRVLCVTNRVPWVGAAFGSKFLYFADPHGRAVVLDRVVRGWLAEHADIRLRGGRDEREYARWILVAEQWAGALGIAVDVLELIIFSDALAENSPWKPKDHETPPVPAGSGDGYARDADPARDLPARVVLLGCVKHKLDHPAPAKSLYVSPLWLGRRAYAQASGNPWLILSAKHGLLDPDQQIAPYDVALRELDAIARGRWGDRVIAALLERYGALDGITFEIHAGAAYRHAITPALTTLGASVDAPLSRLTMGRQLSWYRTHNSPHSTTPQPVRRRGASARELHDALMTLDTTPVLIAARDWPATLTGLNGPGLYAWWADEPGARMLATGLGVQLPAGRIYAGQTGATKWPSGTTGRMTLAKRITTNHLNGRIAGSTFRLTLAAILADELNLTMLAPQRLSPSSEQALSAWMRAHLHVAVHPFPDPDALADLEDRLLAQLDPPLNLTGRPTTLLRACLTLLRGRLA